MNRNVKTEYLESKVLTATPQKLHLMLIDGAISHAQLAADAWDDSSRLAERDASLRRAIAITGELLAGVRGCELEFASQLVSVYNFIFRRITEAKIHEDKTFLKEALRILKIERETWAEVCARFGSQAGSAAPQGATPVPHVPVNRFERSEEGPPPSGGLSLQA